MHPVNILRIFAFSLGLGGIQILTIHYFNSFWDTLFTVGGLLSLIAVQPNNSETENLLYAACEQTENVSCEQY
jgi:putative alpha-1,2-mannosidase